MKDIKIFDSISKNKISIDESLVDFVSLFTFDLFNIFSLFIILIQNWSRKLLVLELVNHQW